MYPELKGKISNHAFQVSKKIDEIFSKYKEGERLDIKDIEDIKRYSYIMAQLTDSLNKDFY